MARFLYPSLHPRNTPLHLACIKFIFQQRVSNAVMKKSHRHWSTPLIIASGIIIAVSGVMMFFHLGTGLIQELHEWIGVLFAVGMLFHIHQHWQPFRRYFSQKTGIAIMITMIALSSGMLVATGDNEEHPAKQLAQQFSQKSLTEIAQFQQRPIEQLLIDMEIEQIEVRSPEISLQKIAEENHTSPLRLIKIIVEHS